jgi:hypothetical protein
MKIKLILKIEYIFLLSTTNKQTNKMASNTETFVKWTEEDFCDRDTCYFCKTKNNGDWDKSCEDAICWDCSSKWEYNENDDGYYRKCYDCGACDKCKEWNTDEEEEEEEDTDSEDKRDGDYYIVRHEECVYDKDGEVSEMDIIYEEEFDHLRDAREMYNEIKVKPYGELVYLDMITCDGSDQDNIDCRGTMKKD